MSALISNPAIRSLIRGVLVWAPLWIGTTILFGILGVVYAFVLKSDTYLASQALLVRDEANGAVMRLGRFQSQAEMKAAQETILEMSKSHQVVRDALLAVGKPPSLFNWFGMSQFGGEYPSKDLVEETAKQAIQVHAPKGTEFGVTEVIYLDVKSNTTHQAVELNKALCDALQSRLQQVRRARADGVIEELQHARESARRALTECTLALNEIEKAAGADLTDLRGMTESIAGSATSRAEFDQIKNEIRQVEATRQVLASDREMLTKATDDPTGFVSAPGSILNSHPGLKRMREGLVDAQIAGANILGKFTSEHPSAIASTSAQASIIRRFSQELKASIASLDADIALADRKLERLESQKKIAEERLSRLATSRANYANLLTEVKSRSSILDATERELAEAQASRDSSMSTSLLTRLDAPIVSDRPLGPGRTTLSALSAIAGLVFGLGIVFVITPIDMGPSYGRRAIDRVQGRRSVDSLERGAAENRNENVSIPPQPVSLGNDAAILAAKSSSRVSVPSQAALSSRETASASGVASEKLDNLLQSSMLEGKLNKYLKPNPAGTSNRNKLNVDEADLDSTSVSLTNALMSALGAGKVEGAANSQLVDEAFREIAKLKSMTPESRADELSIDGKIKELRQVLAAMGHSADTETMSREGWLKPRSTKS